MKHLTLNPDWKTSPICIGRLNESNEWSEFKGFTITPEDLPLSQKLIAEIWDWADIYDTFLDWNDPSTPKEIDPKIEADFWAKGEVLLYKIQSELGEDYSIKAGWNTQK